MFKQFYNINLKPILTHKQRTLFSGMVRKQDVMNQHRKCVECELKVLNIPDDDAYKAPKRVRKDKCVK